MMTKDEARPLPSLEEVLEGFRQLARDYRAEAERTDEMADRFAERYGLNKEELWPPTQT